MSSSSSGTARKSPSIGANREFEVEGPGVGDAARRDRRASDEAKTKPGEG
jgi:hypothetical protein